MHFEISSCNVQKINGVNMGSFRPEGRSDFHIIFVAEGKCYVTFDGQAETVIPHGSAIVYMPGCPQKYRYRAEDSSVSYYIHFDGEFIEGMLESLKIGESKAYSLANPSKVRNVFDELVSEYVAKKKNYEIACEGLVYLLMTEISRQYEGGENYESSSHSALYETVKAMNERYAENLSVEEYAKMCNLSVGRYIHIFKDVMSVSPGQYLINIRIEKAKNLLTESDLSVSQVAELLGFSDSNYFSRLFKKHTGESPGNYRNRK